MERPEGWGGMTGSSSVEEREAGPDEDTEADVDGNSIERDDNGEDLSSSGSRGESPPADSGNM